MSDEETTRITQIWPVALKEEVQGKAGKRGMTEFTLAALRTRLAGEDRAKILERELSEVKYLAQLLADRYAMGGSAADRESALMEVELPSWMDTTGWPEALAKQVPTPTGRKRSDAETKAKVALIEPVETEPTRIPETNVGSCPFYRNGKQCNLEPKHDGDHDNGTETWSDSVPKEAPKSGDLLARVQAKAAEKGVEIGDGILKPASQIEPPKADPVDALDQAEQAQVNGIAQEPHNHEFARVDGVLVCECGGRIEEGPLGGDVYREPASEPASDLAEPTEPATPVAPERDLEAFDAGF